MHPLLHAPLEHMHPLFVSYLTLHCLILVHYNTTNPFLRPQNILYSPHHRTFPNLTNNHVSRNFPLFVVPGGDVEGRVTWMEFLDFFAGVSLAIEDEDYFELMMRNAVKPSGDLLEHTLSYQHTLS